MFSCDGIATHSIHSEEYVLLMSDEQCALVNDAVVHICVVWHNRLSNVSISQALHTRNHLFDAAICYEDYEFDYVRVTNVKAGWALAGIEPGCFWTVGELYNVEQKANRRNTRYILFRWDEITTF